MITTVKFQGRHKLVSTSLQKKHFPVSRWEPEKARGARGDVTAPPSTDPVLGAQKPVKSLTSLGEQHLREGEVTC